MKNPLTMISALVLLSCTSILSANDFDNVVNNWDTYQDVGEWLNKNFHFEKQRQQFIRSRIKTQGPDGLLIRDPQKTFINSSGYCADSAHFAREAINGINPEYNAQWVFIKNDDKGPNHW